jgi:hypothetical protein
MAPELMTKKLPASSRDKRGTVRPSTLMEIPHGKDIVVVMNAELHSRGVNFESLTERIETASSAGKAHLSCVRFVS